MPHNQTRKYAPVAIFCYNRLSNIREVISALQKNYLASETCVYVFSDGPKSARQESSVNAVRTYLKTITGFKSFTVIERPENFYIERNIIEGVTEVVNRFGRIIVLEDDGVTAPNFLNFMNQSLDFYDNTKRVMHIATFTFINMPTNFRETFFWRYTENGGGGWATWADRWKKFQYFTDETTALNSLNTEQKNKLNLDGTMNFVSTLKYKIIPWDICWYMTLVRNNGLAVNSPHALTINNGLYNGTHFSPLNRILGKHQFSAQLDTNENIIFSNEIEESKEAIERLKKFYATLGTRKRDKILHYFVRFLVLIKVTKVLKWWLK